MTIWDTYHLQGEREREELLVFNVEENKKKLFFLPFFLELLLFYYYSTVFLKHRHTYTFLRVTITFNR